MAAGQASGMLSWDTVASLKDPALQGRWFCFVPDSTGTGGTMSVTEVLVEHMGLEWYSNQPKPRPRTGTHDKFPDFAELPPITLTFYENEDFDVTKWLGKWRKEVWDTQSDDDSSGSQGYYGLPLGSSDGQSQGYRRDFTVYLFAKADETPIFQIVYAGCWPIGRGPIELSYAEMDGRLTVSAQFAVTRLRKNSNGTNDGSVN